jgi:hypothetical protein
MENLDDLINDIDNIENNIKNNIDKINIIIIKINKNETEDIIKKKQTKNKEISIEFINSILNRIKEEFCKEEYNIKYLLNFEINKNIYELEHMNDLNNINNYKLDILNKIKKIDYQNNYFNNINSLIIILNKKDKIHYIKKKQKKQNSTKKLNK